jgi:hypothetical protein
VTFVQEVCGKIEATIAALQEMNKLAIAFAKRWKLELCESKTVFVVFRKQNDVHLQTIETTANEPDLKVKHSKHH